MADISYNVPAIKVQIDGQEYTVPARTERLERQLKQHDDRLKSVSQYQSDYDLVKIILGTDAAKQIFPNGEDENLDRMHYIAVKLMEIYYKAYKDIEDESFEDSLDKLGRISDKVGNLAKLEKLAK
jgi:hypothetical protein